MKIRRESQAELAIFGNSFSLIVKLQACSYTTFLVWNRPRSRLGGFLYEGRRTPCTLTLKTWVHVLVIKKALSNLYSENCLGHRSLHRFQQPMFLQFFCKGSYEYYLDRGGYNSRVLNTIHLIVILWWSYHCTDNYRISFHDFCLATLPKSFNSG